MFLLFSQYSHIVTHQIVSFPNTKVNSYSKKMNKYIVAMTFNARIIVYTKTAIFISPVFYILSCIIIRTKLFRFKLMSFPRFFIEHAIKYVPHLKTIHASNTLVIRNTVKKVYTFFTVLELLPIPSSSSLDIPSRYHQTTAVRSRLLHRL